MEECNICMESFPKDVYQYLPCFHKMCKFCFVSLKKPECPYCKYSFSDELTEKEEEDIIENLNIPDEPINHRRCKKNKKKKNRLFELRKNSSSSIHNTLDGLVNNIPE
jgi:hypothetical protein